MLSDDSSTRSENAVGKERQGLIFGGFGPGLRSELTFSCTDEQKVNKQLI